jgi:phage terminase small subunit
MSKKKSVATKSLSASDFGLNSMQNSFCQFIVAGQNVGDAYIAAGYSVKNRNSAQSAGSRLLGNVKVQRYIDYLQRTMRLEMGLTTTAVLQATVAIAMSNIMDYVDIKGDTLSFKDIAKLPPLKQSAISEIQINPGQYGNNYRIKLHPKQPALDRLFETLGLNHDMDSAISALRRFGYEVRPTPRGYEVIDAYGEQLNAIAPGEQNDLDMALDDE